MFPPDSAVVAVEGSAVAAAVVLAVSPVQGWEARVVAAFGPAFEEPAWELPVGVGTPALAIVISASAEKHFFVVVVAVAPASAVGAEPLVVAVADDVGDFELAHLLALVTAFAAALAYSCRPSFEQIVAASYPDYLAASFQPYLVAGPAVAASEISASASSFAVGGVAVDQRSFAGSVAET